MKASFKKLMLLSFHQDRERITKMLQGLGVVHLEINAGSGSKTVEELEQEKNRINRAINTIQARLSKRGAPPSILKEEAPVVEELVDKILELSQQYESNTQQLELLHKDELKLAPWGNFDSSKVEALGKYGLQFVFCVADKKTFRKSPPENLTYQVVYEGLDQVYFVVIFKGKTEEVPYEIVDLPTRGIGEIQATVTSIKQRNQEIIATIQSYSSYLPLLSKALQQIENDLNFSQASNSFRVHSEGRILSINGWFPASMEDRMTHYLNKEGLTYIIEDPTSSDEIPVLLKNPKYPKLFESITNIFELPNYYELDPTPFIAVFYPILFAYCLGDAGYGAILTLAAAIGWFTFLKSMRSMALLGVILGVFTTLMGVVKSGSVFGLPLSGTDSVPFFQFLSQYIIIPDDRDFIFNAFNVALMIGVVQILLGILISIYNKIKYESFIASLSQVGKFFIVFGLIWIFLADMQGVKALEPYLIVRRTMLFIGIGLVMFFHDLSQSIFKRPTSAILPLFFIATGILGDILSYVRLFALGVASSVLGLVVNQIGMQIMSNGWLSIILGVVFLLFGHSLNFGIALLGAFVHPLRLTFVEFYNNAQFQGGGIAYRPFRKIELTDK